MPHRQTIKTYTDYAFFDSIDDLYAMRDKYPDVEIRSLRDEDSENPSYYVEEMNFVIIDNYQYHLFKDDLSAMLKDKKERLKIIEMQKDCIKMKKKLLRAARCKWKSHIKKLFGGYKVENEFIQNYARNYLMFYQMLKTIYNANLLESGELGIAYPIRLACLSIALLLQVS